MGESRTAPQVLVDGRYADAVEHAFGAAHRSAAALQAAIEMAEADPEAARAALWRLQADRSALERIERGLGGKPTQATLRLGAAIHLARAELASPAPQLRRLLPELLEWLGCRR